jgi:hypothetical protein
VSSEIPDPDFWEGRIPPVIQLREVATLVDSQLQIDEKQVLAVIRSADDDSDADQKLRAKHDQMSLRRGVREEIKSMAKNDILVQAYRTYGSGAKAVVALAADGVETNKSAVLRAVNKSRGKRKAKVK